MTQRDKMSRRNLRAHSLLAPGPLQGLTLVEMLVAISITLVMMAALVTVFSNISGSVTRRRATIELSSALRNVRDTLARDLAGATCPTVPWQRPESNVGYFELIEGPYNDYYPTPWLWDGDGDLAPDPIGARPGIDLTVSSLPGSNLRSSATPDEEEGRGRVLGNAVDPDDAALVEGVPTDGRGLGDADDTLMLTVRNEDEPFIGRIPKRFANDGLGNAVPVSDPASRTFDQWGIQATGLPAGAYNGGDETIESSLAEVVWFAVENPTEAEPTFAFGEAGYRTIYRRALLIVPDLDYGIVVRGQRTRPGVVWVLPEQNATGGPLERIDVATALASLIAFQERYDLSVRLEWDPLLPSGVGLGRWVIMANSLSDLTKRENRFEHHGYAYQPPDLPKPADSTETAATGVSDRYFPFAAASLGNYNGGPLGLEFRGDAAHGGAAQSARFQALTAGGSVVSFQPIGAGGDPDILLPDRRYRYRPFVRVTAASDTPATARAILNEDGNVVHVTSGLAPLSGARRGDDIMITDALAFDLRAFDPGAPTYAYYPGSDRTGRADQVLRPGDAGWASAFQLDVANWPATNYGDNGVPGDLPEGAAAVGPFSSQRAGAYVDLGYGSTFLTPASGIVGSRLVKNPVPQRTDRRRRIELGRFSALRFFEDGLVRLPSGAALTFGFATFDTWSTHYESNGVNEDLDRVNGLSLADTTTNSPPAIDEGIDGFESPATYYTDTNGDGVADSFVLAASSGPDDPAERETRPPYDTSLRGVQVTLRVYERDSRQMREVKVRESFVPE